jgi:hypothetical protein
MIVMPKDAGHLALQFHPGVSGPLPLAALERGHRLRHVARGRQQQRDGMLGRADNIGTRRVHHHDPGLSGRVDVDIVESHAGSRDDPQPRGAADRLGVDGGSAPHDDGVRVGQGRQQLAAVGAVGVADLEVRL